MNIICFPFNQTLFNYEDEVLPAATHYIPSKPRWDDGRWVFSFTLLRFDETTGEWFRYETDNDDEYPNWAPLAAEKVSPAAKAFVTQETPFAR